MITDEAVAQKLDQFFSQFKHLIFKKGEILIRADDDPAGIFYLKKGTVRQYAISKDGEEQTLNLYKPISFFPLMWAVNSTPNTYYFEAVSEVEICRAPKDQVISFIKQEPDILYDLVSRLYRGMHGLLSRIEYLQSGDAYAKVVFALLNYSLRFGEQKEDKGVELSITHRELASLTGLTKETISRECTKLEGRGLIKNSNHRVLIKDIKKLEGELLGT